MLRSRRLARQSLDFAALSPGFQIERPLLQRYGAREENQPRMDTKRKPRMDANVSNDKLQDFNRRWTQMGDANLASASPCYLAAIMGSSILTRTRNYTRGSWSTRDQTKASDKLTGHFVLVLVVVLVLDWWAELRPTRTR